MPPLDSLKLVSKSLESQQGPEPEELKKGKEDLKKILTKLAEKEKEIESSADPAEKKSERYAKIAEVLKTQVLPVLQSWLTKYPEKKEGITKAIGQIQALTTKYEKKSEELKENTEQRTAASEAAAESLQAPTLIPSPDAPGHESESKEENLTKQAISNINVLLGVNLTDIGIEDTVLVDGQQMKCVYVDIDPSKNEYSVHFRSDLAEIAINNTYGSRIEINNCSYEIANREEVKEFLTGRHDIVRNKIEKTESIKRQAINHINKLLGTNLKDFKIGDKILINGAEMECEYIRIEHYDESYAVYYVDPVSGAKINVHFFSGSDLSEIKINGEEYELTAKNAKELLQKLSVEIKQEQEKKLQKEKQEQEKKLQKEKQEQEKKLQKEKQEQEKKLQKEKQEQELRDKIMEQLEIAGKNETSWQEAERILKKLLTFVRTKKELACTDIEIETKYSTGKWDSAEELILNELQSLREDYVRTKIEELDLDLEGMSAREKQNRGDLAKNILGICKRRGVSPLDIGIDGIFTKGEDLDYTYQGRLDHDDYYTQWNKNKEILQRVEKATDDIRGEIPEKQKKQEEIKRRIESVIELSNDLNVSWQEAEEKLLEIEALVKKDPSLGRMYVYVYNHGLDTAVKHIENALWRLHWKYIENKAKERSHDFEGLDDESLDRNNFVYRATKICLQKGVSPLEIDMDQFFNEFNKRKALSESLADLADEYGLKDLFIWGNVIYNTDEVEQSLPKIEEALKKLSEEERAKIAYRIVVIDDGREGVLTANEGDKVFGIDYKKSAEEIADKLKEAGK